jgi:thiol-disulfide isomerase/thioredoxin
MVPDGVVAQEGDRIYLPIGSEAPALEGVAIDGAFYSLREMLAEGPVFLIFWNDPCGHNPAAIPLINSITNAYEGKARLLGVVVSSVEGAKVWQEDFQPHHPVIVDPPGKWIDAYEMVYSVVPMKVGTDGRIADVYDGYGQIELQRLNEGHGCGGGNAGGRCRPVGSPGAPPVLRLNVLTHSPVRGEGAGGGGRGRGKVTGGGGKTSGNGWGGAARATRGQDGELWDRSRSSRLTRIPRMDILH